MILHAKHMCRAGRLVLTALTVLALAGCVTSTPKPKAQLAAVHILVSPAGIATYAGEHFGADQIPARLAKTGVEKTQDIRIHMADIHNTHLMAQIYNSLHSKGYLHVLFQDELRASSEVVGEPETRAEAPAEKPLPVPAR